MEAKELRLGNLINYKAENWDSPQEVEVFNICRSYCRAYIDNELEDVRPEYEYCTGIPLTEEWLLKLGLEKNGIYEYWIIKDWKIYYSKFNEGVRFPSMGWITDFKYIHQLQNLYFALTGEELTIK